MDNESTDIKVRITKPHKSIKPGTFSLPRFVVLSGKNGSGKTHFLEAVSKTEISEFQIPNEIRKFISFGGFEPHTQGGGEGNAHAAFQAYSNAKNVRIATRMRNPQLPLEKRLSSQMRRKAEHVATHANKNLNDLTLEDFEEHAPVDDASFSGDPFSQQFESVFRLYFEKKQENDLREYRNQYKGYGHIEYLNSEEFQAKFGNPIEEINSLLDSARLGYQFNQPHELDDLRRFELKLIDSATQEEIAIQQLSSGEKVIMCLVFAMYNANKEFQMPQILLMDEPDASLHPSLTKQFLDVIQELFVNKGVVVIMSTHSPSTVALAPEDALFVMDRESRKPEKASKDELLKVLLDGVPSLRVDYENRRQVFVESENDVKYYEKFYDNIIEKLIPEKSLNFISSGESKQDKNSQPIRNCSQVQNITNTLRSVGLNSIFGIIDYDKDNQGNDWVKVLGEGRRYSIDSYILDPIYVGAYLLRGHIVPNNELGLEDEETYPNLSTFSNETLQKLVNFVTEKVKPKINPTQTTKNLVNYVGGRQLEIDDWYLLHQGHELEEHMTEVFPQLHKFRNQGGLGMELLKTVIPDLREFVPTDILEVFKSIQDG